jgi:pyrimidine operon attenuation protein/uracil phosphoribosyltransferase
MARKKKVLMSAQDIERALDRITLQILERNLRLDDLVIVGIHTGGVFLADRIHRIIEQREKRNLPAGSLDISFEVEGKTMILVDDVLYTGRTIRAALDAIMDFGRPSSIQLAVLVDRGGRELPIQPDYTGMDIKVDTNQHIHVLLLEDAGTDEVVLDYSS